MSPTTQPRATPNPGLPGFARFWGDEISRSGNTYAPESIEASSLGDGKLSLKKVVEPSFGSVTARRADQCSFRRREFKTFFEESFLPRPARAALKNREITDEEGLRMASTQ
jgi:hypothetical protein